MKKNHPLFITLLVFCMLQACNPTTSTQSLQDSFAKVPELINRNSKIQNGKEWETVQNEYVKNRNAVIAQTNEKDARINLSYLFINEARITGEHGHYYPAALAMLDQVLNSIDLSKDDRFRALSAKAGVLLSLHQFNEALLVGEEAVSLNPYNAQIYGALVDANVELGNYAKAVEVADKMVSIRPDLRSYSRVSYLREIHGDVKGAIEAMKMAIQSGTPGSEELAWTVLTLGDLYEEYGYTNEAKSAYNAALEIRPDYPFATGALADLEIKNGNFVKAEEMLTSAVEAIPEFSFYLQLIEIYNATERKELAERTLEEVFVMLKDDTENGHVMNLEYADIYSELKGDYENALQYVMKEYDARPNNIDVNRELAAIYLQQGDMASAKKHVQKAAITKSQKPELITLLQKTNA